jgi:hypothetical protein
MFEVDVLRLPVEYILSIVVLGMACAFAVKMRHETWAPPFIAVLGTIAAWYMIEPLYFEDFFYEFTYQSATGAYLCVLIFLVSFCALTPFMVKALQPETHAGRVQGLELHPEQMIPSIVGVWIVLLAFGVFRAEGNVFAALFPIEGRSGLNMWSRAAADEAGAAGFIVSAAAYLYVLVLSLFGLLLPLTKKPGMRLLLIACILVSWPYAFLQGSRNVTLAVVIPALAAYLLIGRRPPLLKFVIAVTAFALLDLSMRAIIQFRNEGFGATNIGEVEQARHLGLNMASELIWIVGFVEDGIMQISYGWGYLSELLNVVPRALWADKPILGIDYAIARGFGGGQGDIGVFATLSTGVIGQGVMNFGTWVGPAASALLMATWVGVLARLRDQGGVARTALFLVGLGLTFNLGRDVTLLVLFPFVFGYIGVRFLEARQKRRAVRDAIANQVASVPNAHFPRRPTTQFD